MDIEKFLEETAPLIDKAIEKYIPRKYSKDAVLFKVNPPVYSYTLEPLNKAIADPIWDRRETWLRMNRESTCRVSAGFESKTPSL